MAATTIGFGSALIVLGVIAFAATGGRSWTALIPAIFGVVLLIFGVAALKATLRRHAMHAAVLVGVLGLVGSLMRPAKSLFSGGTVQLSAAVVGQLIMAVLCALFIVLCVRSFVLARRGGGSQNTS